METTTDRWQGVLSAHGSSTHTDGSVASSRGGNSRGRSAPCSRRSNSQREARRSTESAASPASGQLRPPGTHPQTRSPQRRRAPLFAEHIGLDFELYKQAYAEYRTEEEYLRALRARPPAPAKESWGGGLWKSACGMASLAMARLPRRASRSSGRVAPVSEPA
uniref:Uncharacterized protein n=1 Tax=Alexandrium monilatum TaxID=311494 RepID=A0A7S4SWF6_9DINO